MWLSRKFKSAQQSAAETGIVTLNENGETKANSSLASTTSSCYTPYGYTAPIPVGEEVLVVNGASGAAVAGTVMGTGDLEQGEIEIKSLGGARILLKNDGSVQINSLVIDKNGNTAKG